MIYTTYCTRVVVAAAVVVVVRVVELNVLLLISLYYRSY